MKKLFLWILSLPLSYFSIILFYQPFHLVNWVNFLFLFGLVLLVAGCLMTVIAGGFFTSFLYSCKVFFRSINKKEQVITEIEGKKAIYINDFLSDFFSTKIMIHFGLGYCALSLFLSFLIVF